MAGFTWREFDDVRREAKERRAQLIHSKEKLQDNVAVLTQQCKELVRMGQGEDRELLRSTPSQLEECYTFESCCNVPMLLFCFHL